MSVIVSDQQNKLIENVALRQGFQKYTKHIAKGSLKGDGYLGEIFTVELQEESKSYKLNLIMKVASSSEKLRENTPIRKAYEREIFMYEQVFPLFKIISEELNIKNVFMESPRSFGYSLEEKEECILLENLKEVGFRMWNRLVPMDYDHTKLVFSCYGKFHASGIVMKLTKPEKFTEMSKDLIDIFQTRAETDEDLKRYAENSRQIFAQGAKAVANNQEAHQRLLKFANCSQKFFLEDLRRVDKTFTILHGDCWCNNMIFKYDDSSNPLKPTEMRFLDFQLSKIGSPIADLSYFFYASVSKALLYNLPKFLKTYYESFSKTITEAGLNVNEILTFDELEAKWKANSKFGLFMTLFVIKLVLNDSEEAPDLVELAEANNKDLLESINSFDNKNTEQIYERISDLINFMCEYDFL